MVLQFSPTYSKDSLSFVPSHDSTILPNDAEVKLRKKDSLMFKCTVIVNSNTEHKPTRETPAGFLQAHTTRGVARRYGQANRVRA